MRDEGPRRWRRARAIAGLLILVPVALILGSLAYQAPLRQTVYVGGDLEQRRRFDDEPFLSGVHGSEPGDRVDDPARPGERIWWWELLERSGARPYRWTKAEAAFLVPGAGAGPYVVEVLAGGRRGGAQTVWEAGPGLRYELSLPEGQPRRYRLLAYAGPTGDLRLSMRTTPYTAPGDPRELGFVLHELRVAPAQGPPYTPAWPQLGWLALAVAGIYIAALAAGAGLWGAGALAAGGALAAAYVLAAHRPALTLFTPALALLAGLCAAVSLGGRWGARALERRGAAPGLAPMVALAAAAFALRAAGMLHPHALYSDSGLQANKLYEVMLGRVFLTAGLPSDAGGGQAPYPPGPFLTLMPLALLAPAGRAARVLLMQLGTALLDSLVLAAIWLILRRAGAGQRAALLGAACYLLPVAALESFSVGELANLGGQALALPFITLLALGGLSAERSDGHERQSYGGLAFTLHPTALILSIALLAHSGVTLSVGALVAAAWALAVAAALRGWAWPVGAARLSVAAGAGLGLALLIYYSAPVYLGGLTGRGGGGVPPGAILAETVLAVLGLAPPGRRALALPTLLGVAALAGLALLWATRATPRGGGAGARALRVTLAAWWGGVLLTQGLLLVADQGVRWALFLYPGLCLSAGPLLAALWRRGRAGRLVAGLALAAIIVYGLGVWIVQVRDYYHI